ncbi:NlpC/P60 family protein [Streptomyces griseoviridis]|uniref:C40 family peptidase n=1 Tax=Streptomyces griseoviridis TaxID=45398 RepID=UPI00340E9734
MTTTEEGPTREEVRRRVNTLYDRAESDTGTFNATRAMSTGSRGRGAQGGGRGVSDADLENVTRRLFDLARSSVGPTLPAVLPADRMPARPAPRPGRPAEPGALEPRQERPALPTARAVPELPAAGPVPELTARAVAALPPAAPAPAPTALEAAPRPPEPATAPTAILPAIPEPRRGSAAEALPPALTPALPVAPSPAAPTSRQPSRQAALREAKEAGRRKVAAARELLTRQLAQRTGPLPVTAPAPAPAERTPTGQMPFGSPQAQQTPFPQTTFTQPEIPQAALPQPEIPQPEIPQTAFPQPQIPQTALLPPTPQTAAPQPQIPQAAAQQPSFPFAQPEQAPAPQQSFLPTETHQDFPAHQGFPAQHDLLAHQHHQAQQEFQAQQVQPLQQAQPTYQPAAFVFTDPQQQLPETPFYFGDGQQVPAQPPFEPVPSPSTPWPQSAERARRAAEEEWRLRQPSVLDTGVAPAAPTAPVRDAGIVTKADRAIAFARAQIGRPCVWGAAGPGSYDNGTLVQAAWRSAGVALPRLAHEQAGAGTIVPLAEARPGDLIFFHDNFSHVGLYTGNGQMIHAPGPGAAIREESAFYAGESALRIAVRPV